MGIGGGGAVVSGIIAVIREAPLWQIVLIGIGIFFIVITTLISIWNYRKKKTLYLEDALASIDRLTEHFISLMSTTNEEKKVEIRKCPNEWMRKQIRLFLNAVVEGLRFGIPVTSESSQYLLTEWSERMSAYAYKHFRSSENVSGNKV